MFDRRLLFVWLWDCCYWCVACFVVDGMRERESDWVWDGCVMGEWWLYGVTERMRLDENWGRLNCWMSGRKRGTVWAGDWLADDIVSVGRWELSSWSALLYDNTLSEDRAEKNEARLIVLCLPTEIFSKRRKIYPQMRRHQSYEVSRAHTNHTAKNPTPYIHSNICTITLISHWKHNNPTQQHIIIKPTWIGHNILINTLQYSPLMHTHQYKHHISRQHTQRSLIYSIWVVQRMWHKLIVVIDTHRSLHEGDMTAGINACFLAPLTLCQHQSHTKWHTQRRRLSE